MQVFSFVIVGVSISCVEIEVTDSPGFSGIHILGIPNEQSKDMRERIRSALQCVGLTLPMKKIVVNPICQHSLKLSRFGVAALELPIAAAIWSHLLSDSLKKRTPERIFCIGELTLQGNISLNSSALLLEIAQKHFPNSVQQSFQSFCTQIFEKDCPNSISLSQLTFTSFSLEPAAFLPVSYQSFHSFWNSFLPHTRAFKLGLMFSLGARLPLFVVGGPGLGKTHGVFTAAQYLLPTLTPGEETCVSIIHGQTPAKRPLRSPHHSVSAAALVGGQTLQPGEVTLSHTGLLFLDELGEFARSALESLRESMESKQVHLSKSAGQVCFPADFLLIGAANPCVCGNLFSYEKNCICPSTTKRKSLAKLSGPLIDRFYIRMAIHKENLHENESLLTFFSESNPEEIYEGFCGLQKTSYSQAPLVEETSLWQSETELEFGLSPRQKSQWMKLNAAFERVFSRKWSDLEARQKIATLQELQNYDHFLKLASV
jgi:magnesium chelatase family protein